jgi:predicted acyltransferase
VIERLIYSVIYVTYQGKSVPLEAAMYQVGFASWLSPINASLAFAIAFVLMFYGILYVLYRKQIFFKV